MNTPIIAIVGRPNVGKSTLFNRVLGERRAIVEDCPGVTRDRNYALVERFSIPFFLVDTGGYEINAGDPIQKFVIEQSQAAVEEADVIFCLFDGDNGLHPGDKELLMVLRSSGKEVFYIVNKCDGDEHSYKIYDFYALGVDQLFDISARYGREVNNLIETALHSIPDYDVLKVQHLDERERAQREYDEAEFEIEKELAKLTDEDDQSDEHDVDDFEYADTDVDDKFPDFAPVFVPEDDGDGEEEYLKEYRIKTLVKKATSDDDAGIQELIADNIEKEELPALGVIKVAIVGRPNVGKSTLFNRLYGSTRSITSPIAGTTRDSVHTPLIRNGQEFLLIDTAGLRKKGKITEVIERYSTLRALKSLNDADVAVLVLDAADGPTEQDTKIAGLAHEQGLGLILCVNKWDLIEKSHSTLKEFTENIRDSFKFARYAPIVFTSALTGKRCSQVIDLVKDIGIQRRRRIPTGILNRVLTIAHTRATAPTYRGRLLKFCFAAQVATAPPKFALFFNFNRDIHFSYLRSLKNSLRDHFGFVGSDIKIIVRKRGRSSGSRK